MTFPCPAQPGRPSPSRFLRASRARLPPAPAARTASYRRFQRKSGPPHPLDAAPYPLDIAGAKQEVRKQPVAPGARQYSRKDSRFTHGTAIPPPPLRDASRAGSGASRRSASSPAWSLTTEVRLRWAERADHHPAWPRSLAGAAHPGSCRVCPKYRSRSSRAGNRGRRRCRGLSLRLSVIWSDNFLLTVDIWSDSLNGEQGMGSFRRGPVSVRRTGGGRSPGAAGQVH